MKKVIAYLLIAIILILLCSTVVFGVSKNFKIELYSTKTSANPGEEITVILKAKDYENIIGISSYLATIEYDKEIFETLSETGSITSYGNWAIPTFNPSNGMVIAENITEVQDSDIFKINFKIKGTAINGSTTQIKVKNFEASDGDEDIKTNDAIININIGSKSTSNINESTTIGSGTSSSITPTTTNNSNKSQANGIIPKTGDKFIIYVAIVSILIFGAIISFIAYRKYNKI